MSGAPESRERLRAWLDERTGLGALVGRAARDPVLARASRWSLLGGALWFAFALQSATGVLLLFHYVPDTEHAFESAQTILWEVPFGWLVRLAHAHGASLLLALALTHTLCAALRGAYRSPRELVWIAGGLLLVLAFAAALTGYVLPWSQLSYWATTISTAPLAKVPWVGPELARIARGGDLVGAGTLRRAFAAHVTVIPVAMVALGAAYAALAHRAASAAAGRAPAAPMQAPRRLLLEHALAAVGYAIALAALVFFAPSLAAPAQAFAPADPLQTPPNIRPEWYFLWAYQLQRVLPELLALAAIAGAPLLLLALPLLDRRPAGAPRGWLAPAAIAAGALAWLALSWLGARS